MVETEEQYKDRIGVQISKEESPKVVVIVIAPCRTVSAPDPSVDWRVMFPLNDFAFIDGRACKTSTGSAFENAWHQVAQALGQACPGKVFEYTNSEQQMDNDRVISFLFLKGSPSDKLVLNIQYENIWNIVE